MRVPCAPDEDNPASMRVISVIGDQKSDNTTISAIAEGTNDGGRLSRAASSCSIACAVAPSPVKAVDDIGGDAPCLKHKPRQRCGERSAFAIGTSDRCNFTAAV